jgi:hypothetical protein
MADASSSILPIRHSPDFEVTGDGAAAHWNATEAFGTIRFD